ncbi:hypothetical protein [Sediminitomix flava]|uniref:Uncharacterized protein n=1 Tax=Sediminitomix flava TaxID=379075 RepID=A0A315Z592_SEDFL|nr:hypothetical protein [Sediminitomix flava]PWJ38437.1 hypothetical protein BC781_10727 [Sediminitomix flava]
MNKALSLLTSLLLSVAFFSCDTLLDEEGNPIAPEITFKAKSGYITSDATITEGDSINFSWEVVAKTSKIASFVIRLDNDDIFAPDDIDKNEYQDEFGITMSEEGVFTFAFIATDKDGLSTKEEITITVEADETPLSEAQALEWVRTGGNDATGLEMFGLTWTSNTSTSAIINKAADKFVELPSAAWADLASQEALMEAIDVASDISSFEGISVTASKDDYDVVLGTKKDDMYYLIHITSADVDASDSNVGTVITISGEYKN